MRERDFRGVFSVKEISDLSPEGRATLKLEIFTFFDQLFVGDEVEFVAAYLTFVVGRKKYFANLNRVFVEYGEKILGERLLDYPNLTRTFVNYLIYINQGNKK